MKHCSYSHLQRALCAHPLRTAAGAAAGGALLGQLLTEMVRRDSLRASVLWAAQNPPGFFVGAGLLALAIGLLTVLLRRPWAALGVVWLALLAGSYASFYKQAYRGDPLLPADILLAADAASVAKGMSIWPTWRMLAFALAAVAAMVFLRRVRLGPSRWPRTLGCAAVLAGGLWLWGQVWLQSGFFAFFQPSPGNPGALYDRAGFTCSFVIYLGRLRPQKPDGYTSAAGQAAVDELGDAPQTDSRPDIVVVMMESYYHLNNYPGLTGCEELTQTYDRLAKEGISGYYYSDKYSGGTADMEFGALTGFSTSFLPEGVVPYSQYVAKDGDFYAYPRYLQSLGYRTVAIHPFEGGIYSRSEAYPNMGFDTFLDRDDMTHTGLAGAYIADEQAAEELIDQYEAAAKDGPVFLHMVTMQNHIPNLPGEYPAADRVDAQLDGIPDYYEQSLQSVATGLRDADRMMAQITEYFKSVDREVIVLFFGDHQTAIGQEEGIELLDITGRLEGLSAAERWQATHAVPYLMWSNRGCAQAGASAGSFPPYLLLPNFLHAFQAPRTAWFEWLYNSQSTLKGISGSYLLDPQSRIQTAPSEQQRSLLERQATLQYALMFDDAA